MVDSEALKMNLAALRKVDSSISSIVDIGNQVALYKYLSNANKWEKTEIEGTLFVYMRSQKPQHGFMVMNRLSTTNLVEPITENLEFLDQTPFLLYQNGKGCIYAIWFYEQAICGKICKLLTSLSQLAFTKTDKMRQRSFSESNRKLQKQEKTQNDIISLLTKAQDEYDKKSSKHVKAGSQQPSQNGDIVKPKPVRMNGAVTIASDTTPITIGMLFAQAGGVDRKPNESSTDFDTRVRSFTVNNSSNFPNSSGKSAEAILQSLLSNSAHTLQHIEKIQKEEGLLKEMKQQSETRAVSAGERMLSIESVEKDLKEKLNILPRTETEAKSDKSNAKADQIKGIAKSDPIDIPILTPAMLGSSFSSAPIGFIGSLTENSSCNKYDAALSEIKECRPYSPNQLLSPMDFTAPRKKSIQTSNLPSSNSPELRATFLNEVLSHGNDHGDLLHPQTVINGSLPANQQMSKLSVTPLNRDQLREALIFMLQNDENFVIQLHDCYVNRLKSQLNSVNRS